MKRTRLSVWVVTAAALGACIAAVPGLTELSAEPGRRAIAELERGRVRLEVYSGRDGFMLWYLDPHDEWTPLLFRGDPAATVMAVRDGDRIVDLGRSSRISMQQTERRGHAVVQRFVGFDMAIDRVFTPVRSRGSQRADGIRIVITLHNRSNQRRNLGLRVLFDTYLGETAPGEAGHFQLDRGSPVRFETSLRPEQESVRYWLTRAPDRPELTLQQTLQGGGVTIPDRVVFANWKRLFQSTWDYTVLPSRRFSDPPYSLNDSAVAVYYNPVSVQPGASREIVIVLSAYAPVGFDDIENREDAHFPPVPDDEPPPLHRREPDEFAIMSMSPERRAEYLRRLEELDALIADLEHEAERPQELTLKRLQELRQRLDELRKPQ